MLHSFRPIQLYTNMLANSSPTMHWSQVEYMRYNISSVFQSILLSQANHLLHLLTLDTNFALCADPLEATIRSLKGAVKAARKASQGMQRQWISSQRELITLKQSTSSSSEMLSQKQTEAAILKQRHHRLSQL